MGVFRVNVVREHGFCTGVAVEHADLTSLSGRVGRGKEEHFAAIRALGVEQVVRVHRVPIGDLRHRRNLHIRLPWGHRIIDVRPNRRAGDRRYTRTCQGGRSEKLAARQSSEHGRGLDTSTNRWPTTRLTLTNGRSHYNYTASLV